MAHVSYSCAKSLIYSPFSFSASLSHTVSSAAECPDLAKCVNLFDELDADSGSYCDGLWQADLCVKELDCGGISKMALEALIQNGLDDHCRTVTPAPPECPQLPLCLSLYLNNSSDDYCTVLQRALACADALPCSDFETIAFKEMIQRHFKSNCETAPSMCPSTSLPCPSVSFPTSDPIVPLGAADTGPVLPVEGSCRAADSDVLQHCSIFTFSHVRPFSRLVTGGIQTCSLPGSWFLLKHKDLSVEVDGEAERKGADYTRLRKVRMWGSEGRGGVVWRR